MPAPSVRVVVKLPYNRPEVPLNDPPKIEWTPEKADILWKVIERSRSVDSAGADWKGLAAHLEVPLPYLLYRVNARFQEEIRGLKDIQGALSPSVSQPPAKTFDFSSPDKSPSVAHRAIGVSRLSSSKLGVRARLSSLGSLSRPKKVASSSTLTLQAAKKNASPLHPASPPSSDTSDSSDEEVIKEEEAERVAEEEEALNRKLADLQRMMTSEALGLVSNPRIQHKGKNVDRGRPGALTPRSTGSSRMDTPSSRSVSASQSISSMSSQHGSLPEIPSPPDAQSPRTKPLSSLSSSPGPRNPLGSRRHGPLVDRVGDFSSNQGSEASSFSDLSEASISASALESALMSNFGTGTSRLSHFARSRHSRNNSVVPQ